MSAIVAAYGPVDPDQAERMLSRLKHRGRRGPSQPSDATCMAGHVLCIHRPIQF